MICLRVEEENVKHFMEVLLQSKAFDSLWVHTASIDSFMNFDITRAKKPRNIDVEEPIRKETEESTIEDTDEPETVEELEALVEQDAKEAVAESKDSLEEIALGEIDIPKQEYNHIPWRDVRPFVLSIIMQGKPKAMKLVFSLPDRQRKAIDEKIQAFFCNINYKEDSIQIMTSISRTTIDLDKEAEHTFDDLIVQLLNTNKVPFVSEI